MTWTLQRIEETPEGHFPIIREIASNDEGASIEPWGVSLGNRSVLFKYAHNDIVVEFSARRSSRYTDDAIGNKVPFPVGPICDAWIDDRPMRFGGHRPLSTAEWETIKRNITDFLTTTFNLCRPAAPPNIEQVEFR
jgi:hypothetical protein